MYNRYISGNKDAFDDLYSYVEPSGGADISYEENKPVFKHGHEKKPLFDLGGLGGLLNIKKIFKGLNLNDFGIIPLLLLLFLIMDVDDEEKIIIIVLALLFGL